MPNIIPTRGPIPIPGQTKATTSTSAVSYIPRWMRFDCGTLIHTLRHLRIIDLADADHFRQGLLRREITGNMAYQRQRDHSAHTLNNYILGWYFFSNSIEVKKAISEHFAMRGIVGEERAREGFGNLWPFVSLLHDLGYLFEGSINALDNATQNEQIKRWCGGRPGLL